MDRQGFALVNDSGIAAKIPDFVGDSSSDDFLFFFWLARIILLFLDA
jgi:hypothetical protein